MTSYTKRDLRAADMLAMVLFGLGFLMTLTAALRGAGKGMAATPAQWVVAASLLVLGLALHLKVRQLVRHRGREPEEYPGVPE